MEIDTSIIKRAQTWLDGDFDQETKEKIQFLFEKDQDELIDAILLERHREFLGEGKRWFDVVRCNRINLVETRNKIVIGSNQIYFPIHRDHINQNPLLVQNPY